MFQLGRLFYLYSTISIITRFDFFSTRDMESHFFKQVHTCTSLLKILPNAIPKHVTNVLKREKQKQKQNSGGLH